MSHDLSFQNNRRAFLGRTSGLLGTAALVHLLQTEGCGEESSPRSAHAPTADSVVCLFQHGGPSQMDLFDEKTELTKRHGQMYEGDLDIHFPGQAGKILASPFEFRRQGEAGILLSEILPHTGTIVDDMTLVRSITTESVDHDSALRLIHSGKFEAGFPTWGSWVIYGLGTINRNLPAYVVLTDRSGMPEDTVRNWTSGWLPARYQGTVFQSGKLPIPNLATPADIPGGARLRQHRLLRGLNESHRQRYPDNAELAARISNFEVAARMQTAVPELLDLSQETQHTQRMYGIDNPTTAEYGTRCLIARRLIERGVRFVQLFLSGQPWDTHSNNNAILRENCAKTDQPSAALVKDLKQRGLLDRTIVMWGGEFGRLPISQGKDGRDHNRHANSLWLAGGGFKCGYAHGSTDDFGYKAVSDVLTVHNLHATLLHVLGLDHRTLTWPHDGRPGSLTDVAITGACAVPELLA